MNEERFSASNELLDRQDIDLLLATLGSKFEEHIRQHFFTICYANELIESYVDFFAGKPEYSLRLLFWQNLKMRLYRLRQPCLIEKFQKEYADKKNYPMRAMMRQLCESMSLQSLLPKDFFYNLNCQESDFIKEIKGFLKMIKDKNLNPENFSKIVSDEHRHFMCWKDFYKEEREELQLTDKGYQALCVPYSDETLKRYNLEAFMEAIESKPQAQRYQGGMTKTVI